MSKAQWVGLVLVAVGVATAVKATEYTPRPVEPSRDITYSPVDAGVILDAVEPSASVITLNPVRIVAYRQTARKHGDCDFAARPVVQGPEKGMVRGFCL